MSGLYGPACARGGAYACGIPGLCSGTILSKRAIGVACMPAARQPGREPMEATVPSLMAPRFRSATCGREASRLRAAASAAMASFMAFRFCRCCCFHASLRSWSFDWCARWQKRHSAPRLQPRLAKQKKVQGVQSSGWPALPAERCGPELARVSNGPACSPSSCSACCASRSACSSWFSEHSESTWLVHVLDHSMGSSMESSAGLS
mmetsp:Transcript_71436/g.209761  ORF Transcript_71436/g.209761 Transcript_71436/m.209761 type:complete len:206 (+) Transcript_71436:1263-1880(+)